MQRAIGTTQQAVHRARVRLYPVKVAVKRWWATLFPEVTRRSLPAPLGNEVILVLAVARSGSTLLTRLLVAHDDIDGFGEQHAGYARPGSLRGLENRIRFHTGDRGPRARFVLDKIVWDHYRVAPSVLSDPRVHVIVMVREPRGVVGSLSSFARRLADPVDAGRYYEERLETLVAQARLVKPERLSVVDYADLLSEPERTLASLSGVLRLSTPLTEHYDPARGDRKVGDDSATLQAGTIVRPHEHPELPADLDRTTRAAYERAVDRLRSFTTS